MNEKENAVILDGKKYRVFTHEISIECCKGCDMFDLDSCEGFCENFENYFADKGKECNVYFKEVRE